MTAGDVNVVAFVCRKAFVFLVLLRVFGRADDLERTSLGNLGKRQLGEIVREERKRRKIENAEASCPVASGDEENRPETMAWPSGKISIGELPSEQTTGVEEDMLRLCATLSRLVYGSKSKEEFKTKLLADERVAQAFPDIRVRWFQNGVTFGDVFPEQMSLDAPTFVGIITGSTLILCWRGSVTIKDFLADSKIESIHPWDERTLEGLEVQKEFYKLIANAYFQNHWKDIVNYVRGTYDRRDTNGPKKDGTPITRIVLTGHSLGGGLAQVAHLSLRAPATNQRRGVGTQWQELVEACRGIDVKTLAFAAPMTTALKDPVSSETRDFLRDTIGDDMCNVVYDGDLVPRGYAHLEFIDDFVRAFLEENHVDAGITSQFAAAFLRFHIWVFRSKGMREQAERYRHVGKIIHYGHSNATPLVHTDEGLSVARSGFRGIKYASTRTNVAEKAFKDHMVLVDGPGLAY